MMILKMGLRRGDIIKIKKGMQVFESEIRGQVKEYLEWKGWFVFYHLQGLGSYPGLPDLQAIKDGQTIYIEIKRPGGRQSERQKKFQEDLEGAGGIYIVAHGVGCLGIQ